MTKQTIAETAALKALLSETADHQILAEMLGFVAQTMAKVVQAALSGRKTSPTCKKGHST
jgi:hypothetical protein